VAGQGENLWRRCQVSVGVGEASISYRIDAICCHLAQL
jgi:hypothetical protein